MSVSNNNKKNSTYEKFNDEQAQASYDYPKLNDQEIKRPLPPPPPPPPPSQYVVYNNSPPPQQISYQYPYQPNNVIQPPIVYYQPPIVYNQRDLHNHHDENTYEEMEIGNRHPVEIICPSCGGMIQTIVKNKIGLGTNFAAMRLCFLGAGCCLCVIPYRVHSCQDAVHYCPRCDARIGTSAFLC